ncbi:toll-like receptor 4 [Ylistrum balloti]|uniref:toll-like receptor 4 n=1 Tax=Ylistrum balloti TaxID=509963 RepID=UPI002905F45C|nr:toll-like receptor 4 [Ylistrum balloti]
MANVSHQQSQSPLLSTLPQNCTLVHSDQTHDINLNCIIPTDTTWKFAWVQHWAKGHVKSRLNVYVQCGKNSTVILQQPIKAHMLRKLYISSCGVRQMYHYDLTADTEKIDFTIKTMEVKDSVIFITFKELLALYTIHTHDVLSKYPCYLPPSIERYVERNVTVKTEGSGTKTQYKELRKASRIHKFKLQQCEYLGLTYYEKSCSRKNMVNFVDRFLDKGKFPSLRVLNISYLHLNKVPFKLFREIWSEEFPALSVLDISNNEIANIPFSFPPSSMSIVTVNMTNNNITIISESDLSRMESFYPGLLLLQDNPLSCICKLRPLLHFVRQSVRSFVQHYSYMKNMICASPLVVHGRVLVEVTYQELCQEESESENVAKFSRYVFIIILPIMFLLFSVILVICRYRKELKIIAFARLSIRRRRANKNEMNNKEYDAFVSYNSQDEGIVNNMCKRLEGKPYHFRLCLHYKHFIPGVCISENIIESVEMSSHTILVLSKHFIESEWCILEFRKAFQQSLVESNMHLIVVLLEEIDNLCLPTDMVYFLQTHSYLKVNEYLFWDKLVYALSDNRSGSGIHSTDRPGEDKKNDPPVNKGNKDRLEGVTIPLCSTL